MEKFQSPRHN